MYKCIICDRKVEKVTHHGLCPKCIHKLHVISVVFSLEDNNKLKQSIAKELETL